MAPSAALALNTPSAKLAKGDATAPIPASSRPRPPRIDLIAGVVRSTPEKISLTVSDTEAKVYRRLVFLSNLFFLSL
jgi:hypothetical protein